MTRAAVDREKIADPEIPEDAGFRSQDSVLPIRELEIVSCAPGNCEIHWFWSVDSILPVRELKVVVDTVRRRRWSLLMLSSDDIFAGDALVGDTLAGDTLVEAARTGNTHRYGHSSPTLSASVALDISPESIGFL